MNVKYLKAEALSALKNDVKKNEKHMNDKYRNRDNSWILEYFRKHRICDPFGDFKTQFINFELSYDPNKSKDENDLESTIKLYSAMKNLSDSDACDERLWAGMCHSDFYTYVYDRWEFNTKPEYLRSRFFFGQGIRRSLITNTLAKLWWVGRLTYDENENDHFMYTKYLKDGLIGTGRVPLFSNSYTSSPEILKGLLKALQTLQNEGYNLSNKKEEMVKAANYLNVLGGTVVLDIMSIDEICEKVVNYMKDKLSKY